MKGVILINEFKTNKLIANFLGGTTNCFPVYGRKYTLTHSDTTGTLFLSIGNNYDILSINIKMRDEVLAKWMIKNNQSLLRGEVYISGGEFDEQFSQKRFLIFKKEMQLALKAIFHGDKKFFNFYPAFLDFPILIYFQSVFPQYNQVIYYQTPRHYFN